jgi:hypothetical protein
LPVENPAIDINTTTPIENTYEPIENTYEASASESAISSPNEEFITYEDFISNATRFENNLSDLEEYYTSSETSIENHNSDINDDEQEEVYERYSSENTDAENTDAEISALESDDNEIHHIFNNTEKVHPSLECTKAECMLMILAFYLRFNLSWVALESLLLLFNTVLGSVALPNSKYLFKKIFPSDVKPSFHFYCNNKNCNLLVEKTDNNRHCENCKEKISFDTSRSKNFFITLPIKAQVKSLLKSNMDHLIFPEVASTNNTISDISDGTNYQDLLPPTHTKLLTLTMNTDGVNVYKSSKKGSFWPIQMTVNELDKNVRFLSQNIIVTGFWFGAKPIMEIYFKPLIEEMNILFQAPMDLTVNNVQLKIHVVMPLSTLDTLAKDHLQQKISFHGKFGCSYCLHPGVNLAKEHEEFEEERSTSIGFRSNHHEKTHRNLMRYPPLRNIPVRDHSSSLADMKTAFLTQTEVRGFKNITPMAGFPTYNVIDGFAIDYMHCVLLGVTQQLAELWLNPNFHCQNFYIGRCINQIDIKLLAIRPPQNISRAPRSLNDRAYWKANEWRNWLFYYCISCVKNILPSRYIKHFALLSESIFILNSEEINSESLNSASKKLIKFVDRFSILYGNINMTYNVHLLSHIPDCVKKWGPLWGYSNFPFEDNNGLLVSYVKGPTHATKQIISKYSLNKFIQNRANIASELVSDFTKKISSRKSSIFFSKNDKICALGKAKPLEISNDEQVIFSNNDLDVEIALQYRRFIYNKLVFTDLAYNKSLKTNDSLVETIDGTVGFIKLFFKERDEYYILLLINYSISEPNFNNECKHLKSMLATVPQMKIFTAAEIKRKCIVIETEPSLLYSFIPNRYERD